MRRLFALLLIALTFASFPVATFAYKSEICAGTVCTEDEVGKFMVGVTDECAEQGNCTLQDIMTLIVDIGNFVLGIVGVIVLLMYVLGGWNMLTSRGNSAKVTKGKDYLKISTTGFVIVMLAYLLINTLIDTLKTPVNTPATAYISAAQCAEEKNEGGACGAYSVCKDKTCKSLCEINVPGGVCLDEAQAKTYESSENAKPCAVGLCEKSKICCPK